MIRHNTIHELSFSLIFYSSIYAVFFNRVDSLEYYLIYGVGSLSYWIYFSSAKFKKLKVLLFTFPLVIFLFKILILKSYDFIEYIVFTNNLIVGFIIYKNLHKINFNKHFIITSIFLITSLIINYSKGIIINNEIFNRTFYTIPLILLFIPLIVQANYRKTSLLFNSLILLTVSVLSLSRAVTFALLFYFFCFFFLKSSTLQKITILIIVLFSLKYFFIDQDSNRYLDFILKKGLDGGSRINSWIEFYKEIEIENIILGFNKNDLKPILINSYGSSDNTFHNSLIHAFILGGALMTFYFFSPLLKFIYLIKKNNNLKGIIIFMALIGVFFVKSMTDKIILVQRFDYLYVGLLFLDEKIFKSPQKLIK